MEILEFLKIKSEYMLILISAMPVIELRGAIPVGVALGVAPMKNLLFCVLGSTLPAPFLILLFEKIFNWFKEKNYFRWFIDWLDNRINKKGEKLKKSKILGLILLVAIPLPTTGAWTGSMVASIFKVKLKHAVMSIFVGNLIAGIIVLNITKIF